MVDWGEGTYERTAVSLEGAAKRAVLAAPVAGGVRVLDLGCGTGNAAIEAARLGAKVLAVDPAARLLDVARARAAHEGLAIEITKGDAGNIPASDASFDVVLSVFAVIFDGNAERAVAEMLRVVRPGGRIVLTSWYSRGPIVDSGAVLREAMAARASLPAAEPPPAPRWGDPAFVRALFAPSGADVRFEDDAVVFEAASAEAWFADQEEAHPFWITARRTLAVEPAAWSDVRARSIARLEAGNEAKGRFRVTSPYFRVIVTR